MSLDHFIKIPSSHVGASKSLQSRFSHHLGSMFSLLGFHLRVLRDWYKFEYQLDYLYHVTLVCYFHSMSLVCFLLKAFIFPLFAWHTPSLCCHLLVAGTPITYRTTCSWWPFPFCFRWNLCHTWDIWLWKNGYQSSSF